MLRSASSAAQAVHQVAQGAAARRGALVQMLQQALASDVKAWHVRLSALAAAGDSGGPSLGVAGPMETHRELQLCVKQARTDCDQLLAQEAAMAQSLEALGLQLQAAA